ncbi:coiled-coil domain-containing protein 93 isoform X1 [Schistocerca serialis cubense]|uniref:coiled-coil domain-containing protein 93 isoform X1 n=1 Tax=Schistocerca serialis cubense TaxID=2023355 RepID=UPI00214EE7C2|nr:coiled-coil domain-containing protein 93 isoform X1 [Schistocerca serialis cubense]
MKMSVAANVFTSKPKTGNKLSTRIDADGNEVEVEVRDDEEQKLKFQEIIDLLVAAGYFRARIKGLSPFDKVVGGMTWCIETCNFDVDVDLLFQDSFTIGQKIALTEKIVAVLPEMKCPHQIEPHQIQGLDFIHVFPVIQWLVKKSMETRAEIGDFLRSYAVSQFDKQYGGAEEETTLKQRASITQNILSVKELYHPQRRFRRKGPPPEDEETSVYSTLLEYGHSIKMFDVPVGTESGISADDSSQERTVDVQETRKLEEQKIQKLMNNLSSMGEQESRVTAGVVGSIVSLQAQEIAQAAERYAELQAEREVSGAIPPVPSGRTLVAVNRQKAALQEKVMQLTAEQEKAQEAMNKAVQHLQQLKESKEEVETALADKEKLETEENQVILKKLQALVVINETLKQQEQQFREQCKSELTRLQQMVREAQESTSPDEDSEKVAQKLEEERERVQKLRLLLAKRNRSIAALQRQLDEVPGRAELAQYQRRFLELYNQVAAKHKETKQFYTLYNTFDDTKLYTSKELTLLNSILDNYTEAMSSPAGKEQFMKQFDAIVEGIKQNKAKVERRRAEERQRRDRLSQTLLGLVDQQRRYVAAVRQLTIECRRNEVLLAQLRGV